MASTVGASATPTGGSSSVPAAGGSAASVAAVVNYGLPRVNDTNAWRALMLPHAGQLELFKAPGPLSCAPRQARGGPLVPASVWLHCGVHYREWPPTEKPPSVGEMPPLDGADNHYKFFPLPRDDPGSTSPPVRVFQAKSGGELEDIAGRWVLELWGEHRPLRFCFANQKDARAWEKEVLMRVAPLTQVWKLNGGVVGDCWRNRYDGSACPRPRALPTGVSRADR